jgi:hypothetical protein
MEVLHPSVKDVPVAVPNLRSAMFGYVVQHQNRVIVPLLARETLLVALAKKKDAVQENGVGDEIVLDATVLTDLKLLTLTGLFTRLSHLWTIGFLSINESRYFTFIFDTIYLYFKNFLISLIQIIDPNQVYDTINLGRRIDVLWPSPTIRNQGGKSYWKSWLPEMGMEGQVRQLFSDD